MRDVIKLSNDRVQELWPRESVLSLDLRREVTEDDDGRLIRSDQEGSDEQFKVREPLRVATCRLATGLRKGGGRAHFGSLASNSTMMRSVLSGRWCIEQYAK